MKENYTGAELILALTLEELRRSLHDDRRHAVLRGDYGPSSDCTLHPCYLITSRLDEVHDLIGNRGKSID